MSQQDTQRPPVPSRRHVILGAGAAAAALSGLAPRGAVAEDAAGTVLITGSNRGIGLEFARTYAARDWTVIATCRRPDEADELNAIAAEYPKVSVEALDVNDDPMIDALAEKLDGQPIDVLLNNAAILGDRGSQNFGDLDFDLFVPVMRTNVEGPLKMAEAFFDHVAASTQKKIVSITSTQGSIGGLRESSLLFYKSSKAALNMEMHAVAKQLRSQGVIVGLVSPGAVDTDMMKGLGVSIPLLDPADSARMVADVIAGLTIETSGVFLSHLNEEEPW